MSLFVKIDTHVLIEPKFVEAGAEASWLWLRALLWSKEKETYGRFPSAAIPLIGAGLKNPSALAKRLVGAGLWDETSEGFEVPAEKWDRWQTTAEVVDQKRSAAAERKRRQRERQAQMSLTETADVTPNVTPVTRDSHADVTPNVTPVTGLSQACHSRTGALSSELRAQRENTRLPVTTNGVHPNGAHAPPAAPRFSLDQCRTALDLCGAPPPYADRFFADFQPDFIAGSGDPIKSLRSFAKRWYEIEKAERPILANGQQPYGPSLRVKASDVTEEQLRRTEEQIAAQDRDNAERGFR